MFDKKSISRNTTHLLSYSLR